MTGSGGFIGSHLCRSLATEGIEDRREIEVNSEEAIRALAREWRPETVIHLAAKGGVLTPVPKIPTMLDVTVDGLAHVMTHFQPRRVIFASSSAVYGNTKRSGASPTWEAVRPVSIYGMSKAIGELLVRQWAVETGGSAVVLRIGNVIGAGGKGLIAELVRHAFTYPDGSVLMRMRGAGHIVRNYLPVDYVVRILRAAAAVAMTDGATETYNVVSDCEPLTNGQVAQVVLDWLQERGYRLNIKFSDDPGHGEAWSVNLKLGPTLRRYKIPPPSVEQVIRAIVETASSQLERLLAAHPGTCVSA